MKLPKQSTPIMRSDLIRPHTTIDVIGAFIVSPDSGQDVAFDLLHGANYNDPKKFLDPVGLCGCHILSRTSMMVCLANCGLL